MGFGQTFGFPVGLPEGRVNRNPMVDLL